MMKDQAYTTYSYAEMVQAPPLVNDMMRSYNSVVASLKHLERYAQQTPTKENWDAYILAQEAAARLATCVMRLTGE